MRDNQPVTDVEIEVPEGEPLVSRTDRAGIITFANHVFTAVSGFSEQELVGAPHNLVRHPHMPAAADDVVFLEDPGDGPSEAIPEAAAGLTITRAPRQSAAERRALREAAGLR